MKEIISIPNAPRTFHALRSLGYDLYSSIADVVDNAITEKVSANRVDIRFEPDASNAIVCRIQDNGGGMTADVLEEAMRLGTETTYEDQDLGKFGMGMKTASLSHCNVLTVISKKSKSSLCGFRWDIDKVEETQKWTLLQLDESDITDLLELESIEIGEQGTLVCWDDVFNIDRDYHSYENGKLARNYFIRLLSRLRLHLGMVYHRFLDGTVATTGTFDIRINGEPISPWDPFLREEEHSNKVVLKPSQEELHIDGYNKAIQIKGWVMPNQQAFSSSEAWTKGKGLLSWNDAQGYYIYRANRIIRFGGWHFTKAKDEHDKLARISIDIDPELDALFRITVNKNRVQFPELLAQHLKTQVNPIVVKQAKTAYNKSGDQKKVNNNFRRKAPQVSKISKGLIQENKITTHTSEVGGKEEVHVSNPRGTWLANKLHEFSKYGKSQDFEIVSDTLEKGRLWKIVCHPGERFKVIVNSNHPFYEKVYRSSTNKAITDALDAFIFSLAFAELYNKSDQNAQLFDTFKSVCANTLERLIEEKVL
ncbi:DNA mismatch repair enzyme (predicted ATPase) [Owenweeksia hongkongensis DSM 17368]|uniref:DNA mismatch repair enzyme (Predicted ATPase) n=1 Tax=Owenweeksia hongkongensis (strain DSM 17368 / CIP 108786 / JCM 12287 / NRRL B-23963 / UST20020801) TaxID=926562 RepID=G8R874_OWEHD|nr:ATP-binding protein [Owenweeksia hongkongensis]AEV32442.1 DNA mismatch repair enzyme (predicted ATPase) [Owenweeksia hongkongensis DSM 17368]